MGPLLVFVLCLMAAGPIAIASLLAWFLRPRDARGRTRFLLTAVTGLIVILAGAFRSFGVPFYIGLSQGAIPRGDAFDPRWIEALDRGVQLSRISTAIVVVAVLLFVVPVGSLWFLLRTQTRNIIWWVIDILLAGLAVWAWLMLPTEPPANPEARDFALVAIRLILIGFALLRTALRASTPLLSLSERIGVRSMLAVRMLRAKKSGFLAVISTLSLIAVSVSSCSLATTLSVQGGLRFDLQRKILGNTAHVLVKPKNEALIANWQSEVSRIDRVPGVVSVSPNVAGEVMITSSSNFAGVMLQGIVPDRHAKATDLKNTLKVGHLSALSHPEELLNLSSKDIRASRALITGFDFPDLPGTPAPKNLKTKKTPSATDGADNSASPVPTQGADAGTQPDKHASTQLHFDPANPSDPTGARWLDWTSPATATKPVLPALLIGLELARSLRVELGDEVTVVAPRGDLGPSGPMPKSRTYRIAGIFYSGMYEYDMKLAYTLITEAQNFLRTGDAISAIEIKTTDIDRSPIVTADVAKLFKGRPDIQVRDWRDTNKTLFGALKLERLTMFIVLGIAILVAAFCVFGTMTLMVQEKEREVGILMAMGTSPRTVLGIFVAEGLLIGILGSMSGLGLGYMVCFGAEHLGVRIDPAVYYIDRLPLHVEPVEFALVGLAAVVMCVLGTIIPAMAASSLRPVDALRGS